jgi:mRNA-degrading endonuclease RelE of RelBE toxin-antitoxin system
VIILAEIEAYAADPHGHFDVKVLKGKLGDIKRLRAGKYRILFDDENGIVSVYEVKHRQEAYND